MGRAADLHCTETIVNGTRLIYAWDSLSAAGRRGGRRDREERARVAESERQPAKGREASRIWLNIIFSARGNFHFFVRRLPPPPPSPPFQEYRREIRREGGRNPTRFRFYVNVRPWQTQRVASLVLSFVKPMTQHPIRLSLSLLSIRDKDDEKEEEEDDDDDVERGNRRRLRSLRDNVLSASRRVEGRGRRDVEECDTYPKMSKRCFPDPSFSPQPGNFRYAGMRRSRDLRQRDANKGRPVSFLNLSK